MRINKTKILIGTWSLALLCFRPSIFGEKYNIVVFALFSFLTFLIAITSPARFSVQKKPFYCFLLIAILVIYLFVQGILSGSKFSTVFNSCFLILSVSFCVLLVLKNYVIYVLKSIVYIHVVLSLSSIVTIIIFIVSGFNGDNLPIMLNLNNFLGREQAVFAETFANHYVYFPFTHSWASIGIGGIAVPRLIGIYREAGMAQIFFTTSFFITYMVQFKWMSWIRGILLVGAILTCSTSGLLSLAAGYFMLRYLPSLRIKLSIGRLFILFFIVPAFLFFTFFLPDVGIQSKVSSVSGQQRVQSFVYSWNKFIEKPLLGHGYYKGFEKMDILKDDYVQFLGIIGVVYQIGLVGIILYFLPWLYALRNLNDRRTYFILMPCLVTLLFSQPSYNDMFVWFLLLIDFKTLAYENNLSGSDGVLNLAP